VLDEKPVTGITAFLAEPGIATGKPFRLVKNSGKLSKGTEVNGLGFLLSPEEAESLIGNNRRNRDVILPFLNGDDFNSRPDQSASRYVINFFDWPLNQSSCPEGYCGPVASDYPDCLSIVEERVRPERAKNNAKSVKEYWWRFKRPTADLYKSIKTLQRIIACHIVTKYASFSFVPTGMVYNHKLCVFYSDKASMLAILSSNLYEPWVREYCSTLETRLNFSPEDCFENYPLPQEFHQIDCLARFTFGLLARIIP